MLPEMMIPVDYDLLKCDIVGAVLVQAKVANVIAPANPTRPTENSNSEETLEPAGTPKKANRANKMNKMFRGWNTTGASPTANPIAESDENLRLLCRAELEHYLSEANGGACPLQDDEDKFNNPLKWSKKNAVTYSWVTLLARIYLAITASSAPSEQIWSRAARILSLKQASFDKQLMSNIMFVKENTMFLHKHYRGLVKAETEPSLHFLVDLKMEYLPPLPNKEEDLDVGQDDHLLIFI